MICQKTKTAFLFTSLIFCVTSYTLAQEADWQLKKDKEGIQVYTRESSNSDLDEFKGIGIINASVDKLVSTLKDADQMHQWANCKTSRLILLEGNEQVNYTITEVPFPMQDRDSYTRLEYLEVKNGVKVKITAIPGFKPANDGMTRIPYLNGFWLFERISDTQSEITYQLQADPGGSIPAWMSNAGSVDTPFDAIKNLRDYLED
ncbi:MAG: START domain-containing protein [Marinoscillum sp.]